MADDPQFEARKTNALLTDIKNSQAEAQEKEAKQQKKDDKFEKKERKEKVKDRKTVVKQTALQEMFANQQVDLLSVARQQQAD